MKENKEAKLSYWARHLTTVISVTLVLLLLGIIAMISVAAAGETKRLKERIELSAVMVDSISDASSREIYKLIERQPFAKSVRLISRDEALANWTAETGENLEELFGVNPLSPEVAFTVKAEYASASSLKQICGEIRKIPGVEDVASPEVDTVDAMNSNIATLTWILSGIALVMVVISFVLINNTVHLTIYSRRFTIHTMQLVGATKGFIRRPVVLSNMLGGMISGIAASAIIAISLAAAPHAGFTAVASYITWPMYGIISLALIATGAFICALAAWIAATRFLRKDYDQLFS